MAKFISISSSDRTTGTISDFVVRYTNPIEKVSKIKIEQVMIPSTWYTVMTDVNDKIYFSAGLTPYTATLDPGVYSQTDLATQVAAQMNTAYTPDNNFTCTFSSTTYKYTITQTTPTAFSLTFATNTTNSARKLIGFNEADTAAATSAVSDNVVDLGHSEALFVISRNLGSQFAHLGDAKKKVIYSVLANANFGSYITYQSGHQDWDIVYSPPRDFSEIDLRLVFDDGTTQVPLNGVDWRMTFLYE